MCKTCCTKLFTCVSSLLLSLCAPYHVSMFPTVWDVSHINIKHFLLLLLQLMTAISICSTLATALGPHCKQHVRVIGPGLISCLSDSKVSLCSRVMGGVVFSCPSDSKVSVWTGIMSSILGSWLWGLSLVSVTVRRVCELGYWAASEGHDFKDYLLSL